MIDTLHSEPKYEAAVPKLLTLTHLQVLLYGMVSMSTRIVGAMQAAVTDCLHGMGAMCQALLEQLKADAKLAVKQALAADGPFELSPKVSSLVITATVPLHTTTSLYKDYDMAMFSIILSLLLVSADT